MPYITFIALFITLLWAYEVRPVEAGSELRSAENEISIPGRGLVMSWVMQWVNCLEKSMTLL